MPLPFSLVCDLLEQSHELCLARKPNTQAVITWFARHGTRINAPDSNLAALLSTLLPEKRTDRVYCIQTPSLENIIGRALMLGASRIKELAAYKLPGLGLDLADCVERILAVTPNPARPERLQVTVEDVDEILHHIASKIKWSSPSIRTSEAAMSQRGRSDLESIYRQFSAREAKWFTRLVLKDYQPLIFDSHLIYRSCDDILPFVLKIQDDFATAIKTLQHAKGKLRSMLPRTPCTDRKVLATIKPQLSVKVGRQLWFKARSIKHCLDMCQGHMSVEPKIDGEYCQIHVDVSKGRQGIRIFSKSGKDSTEDRHRLLGIIMYSLRIGKPDSNIRTECILEGELVVYSDLERKILPFHHIRKHVTRRGRFMDTEQDSPPRPYEHLMIVYYDMLLIDGQSLLDVRHSERFKLLEKTVHCDKGQAELVPRQIIDTNHALAASALRKAFAKIIVDKEEGLVLKPDMPYFNFTNYNLPFSGRVIKFKKEYIGNFGEVGDFAVVGAGFNPTKAKSYNIENLKWTHFYVGCLDNREEVKRWDAIPEFTVVNAVELNEIMLKTFISHGNPMPVPIDENDRTKLKMAPGVQTNTPMIAPMTIAFTKPPVFDLRCFSFDKAGNTGFWSLRFPSVAKVHFDRDFSDTVSFEELQKMAKEGITAPELEDSQENLAWIAKLEGADPRGLGVDAATQLTATTMPTPSPRQLTQNSASCPPPSKLFTISFQGQSSGSLQQRRVSASQLQGLAERSQSLITPSNSFVADEADQQKSPGFGEKRRAVPPSTEVSPSRKRRAAEYGQLPSSPTRTWSQVRQPLEDRDGNSTQQQTPIPNASFVEPAELPSEKTAGHSTSRARMAKSSTMALEISSEARHSSQSKGKTIIVIPDSDDESSVPPSPDPIEPNNAEEDEEEATQAIETEQAVDQCEYVGPKCQLANRMILLPASLPNSAEIRSLFRAHGLSNVITDAEKWVETDNMRSLPTQDEEPGRKKIMFVDTVEAEVETKALLSRIKELRQDLPEERLDWISVYDWRVLKHITILEDESITKKYYDGFHDPWRRWYCGLL